MPKSLLDQIESLALDGDVVKALRVCISLGGRASSAELREWASHELRGYGSGVELPEYRRIRAHLCIDGLTGSAKFTGQSISTFDLPEFAREFITEDVEIRHSIPALRDMVVSAERQDSSIRLGPPGATDVVSYMNNSQKYVAYINSLYWSIAPTTIKEITERVCTDVVALVSEMRAGMMGGQEVPSPDVASQAFGVVVRGDNNRLTVRNVSQVSKWNTTGDGSPSWIKISGWIAGIVSTIGGLILACLRIVD